MIKSKKKTTQNDVDYLTGNPLPNDILLYVVPVYSPYDAVESYKYRVKLVPKSKRTPKQSGFLSMKCSVIAEFQLSSNMARKNEFLPANSKVVVVVSKILPPTLSFTLPFGVPIVQKYPTNTKMKLKLCLKCMVYKDLQKTSFVSLLITKESILRVFQCLFSFSIIYFPHLFKCQECKGMSQIIGIKVRAKGYTFTGMIYPILGQPLRFIPAVHKKW